MVLTQQFACLMLWAALRCGVASVSGGCRRYISSVSSEPAVDPDGNCRPPTRLAVFSRQASRSFAISVVPLTPANMIYIYTLSIVRASSPDDSRGAKVARTVTAY